MKTNMEKVLAKRLKKMARDIQSIQDGASEIEELMGGRWEMDFSLYEGRLFVNLYAGNGVAADCLESIPFDNLLNSHINDMDYAAAGSPAEKERSARLIAIRGTLQNAVARISNKLDEIRTP